MPQKLIWTAPRDLRLRRLRHQGQSWDAIAADLRISRNAAIERGRRLGAKLAPRLRVAEPLDDPDRPAFPPGHKVSWAVLVSGTLLAETPYPRPMPLGRESRGVIGEQC